MAAPLQFNVSLIAPLLAQHVAFPGAQGKGLRPATGEYSAVLCFGRKIYDSKRPYFIPRQHARAVILYSGLLLLRRHTKSLQN